ncbi:hypothetical protein AAFF_G00215030 [Aldrovandia affinis]|uniref:PDZ domain-containing protein n=1 Tax=Aldrovandia affinis TaxID=143900 RepID=A0AAD7W4D9_9TELE|nr:hypothetical protein AAFF_G00215030 [Aldrovandia affinis]
MATEEGSGSQADGQEGALGSPTHKVSMVIIKDTPDTPITTKTEPWTIRPKSLNQAKVTGAPNPPTGQIKQDYCLSEEPEPRDTENQGDQSRQRIKDYTSGEKVEQKKTVSIDQTGSFRRNTPVALTLEMAGKATSSSPTEPHTTTSSSTDPHTCSDVIPQNQAKDPQGSFGVCLARWSSDEEESDDDDDDGGTEKGSNYDSDSAESSVTITSNMSQSDRLSFSVSLADLYHLGGVDFMGYNDDLQDVDSDHMSHRTASLSSDISAFSCISILPTDELDRLLEDVRGLEDETLQNYEDVQVVVLHKEVGCGLGFTVAGGVDQNKPITVHKVFPFGLASQEGSIREGDQVLSINGTALKTSAHWEALRTLRRARTRGMAVVVLQKGGVAETQKDVADHPQAVLDQCIVQKGRTLRVVLKKSSTDLGFSLEGGLGSSEGDRPLTVKKLFQGGPVGDVFPGDELLEIKGQSLQGLRRFEAWNLIKKLPPGPVEVVLNRPFRP